MNRKPPDLETFFREKDIFYQNSFYTIQLGTSKLRTYSKLIKTIGLEYYLGKIQRLENRITMTKFRHVLRGEGMQKLADYL